MCISDIFQNQSTKYIQACLSVGPVLNRDSEAKGRAADRRRIYSRSRRAGPGRTALPLVVGAWSLCYYWLETHVTVETKQYSFCGFLKV